MCVSHALTELDFSAHFPKRTESENNSKTLGKAECDVQSPGLSFSFFPNFFYRQLLNDFW